MTKTELIDELLQTCERIAKRGEMLKVHRFRYRDDARRRAVKQLVAEGRLMDAGRDNPWLFYCRPEDATGR